MNRRYERNGRASSCRAPDRAARRLRGQACDLGAERRDVAQQPRGSRRVGRLISGNGLRIIANTGVEGGQLGRQPREAVGRRQ